MNNRSGYQLIEAMLVALILAIVGGASLLGLRDALAHYRLQWGVQMLVQDLQVARSLAVTRQLPVSIVVGDDSRSYSIGRNSVQTRDYRRLPRGLLITRKPGREVTFYSRGSAVPAGSYQLTSRAGQMKVVVSGAGRIRWEMSK